MPPDQLLGKLAHPVRLPLRPPVLEIPTLRVTEITKLSRAEALRQAMAAVMDGPGYVDDGKALFSYAHPLF